ncbi:hypothetical protein EDC90_104622, partial [Martelella mediterranea]
LISPYLLQNTKNLMAALHSTPGFSAILGQTLREWLTTFGTGVQSSISLWSHSLMNTGFQTFPVVYIPLRWSRC